MKPDFVSDCGRVKLFCADCMDLMRETPDLHYDLAIVDPPYGIGKWTSGGGANTITKEQEEQINRWDAFAPGPEYFAELKRVSSVQIIWGGNYFFDHLGVCRHVIIWDKKNRGMHLADGELAWTSLAGTAMRIYDKHLSGTTAKGPGRIHPTQKPVELYQWLLTNYAKPGHRILDTHLGSGSSAIACGEFGAHLDATEIDPGYFAASLERIKRELAQGLLFDPVQEEAKVEQHELGIETP
jgi:site-specific DNA-methyltransferase (adenine-specific)